MERVDGDDSSASGTASGGRGQYTGCVTRGQLKRQTDGGQHSTWKPNTKKKRVIVTKAAKKLNATSSEVDSDLKCEYCLQFKDRIEIFSGDPYDAINELLLLENKAIMVESAEPDAKIEARITMFTVYDQEGHLCSFDKGLIEKDVLLYISGYVKPIFDHDPTVKDGVYVKRIGPLLEWWISGFDGGEKALVGVSSEFGDYYLHTPTPECQVYCSYEQKAMLSKLTIEFLQSNPVDPYEDLVDHIESVNDSLTEETLLLHAAFVLSQIESYDADGDDDELVLISTPAARRLRALTGGVRGPQNRRTKAVVRPKAKPTDTLATTTPFVFGLFRRFFGNQMDAAISADQINCQDCEPCRRAPCKKCAGCKSKSKCCKLKACLNPRKNKAIVIEDSNEQDAEEEEDIEAFNSKSEKSQRKIEQNNDQASTVKWKSAPIKSGRLNFYTAVLVDDIMITIGDCLKFKPDIGGDPYLGKVQHMYQENEEKMLHVSWFWRGCDTFLGKVANQSIVFVTNECDSVPAGSVLGKCNVEYLKPDENFRMAGGGMETGRLTGFAANGKECFYYRMCYDHATGRFEEIPEEVVCENETEMFKFCTSCHRKNELKRFESAILCEPLDGSKSNEYKSFRLRGEKFTAGECVFLDPESCSELELPSRIFESASIHHDRTPYDKKLYPERFRKTHDHVCGGNVSVPDPFVVARILSISRETTGTRKPSDKDNSGRIRVAIFYRPENTYLGTAACSDTDFNVLYWSNTEKTVSLSMVMGKCVVGYRQNIPDLEAFRLKGPNRFYFEKAYNSKRKDFENVPKEATSYLGTGKGKAYKDYPAVKEKLRALDVFSGCGGLTEGFHRAGIVDTRWAIESSPQAASAFKLNFPDCVVFNEDCNDLLSMVLKGKTRDNQGRLLPQKGEVDLIMGGPPCQGFSCMNRFNNSEYSLFKNSLITTFLSFIEFYRPKYFVLENVRSFTTYKKGTVVKTVIDALVEMGYQVAFSIMQAGQFGVPQTRRRFILIGAAPGEKLPQFPEPEHVFCAKASPSHIGSTNDVKIVSNVRWIKSAPYRCVVVSDALNDLPPIECNQSMRKMSYNRPAVSHFQRLMRDNGNVLTYHATKKITDLNIARFRYIPCVLGADWRDLPNIVEKKNNCVIGEKLQYTHPIENENRLGVCSCAEKQHGTCSTVYHQSHTVIPWCLSHNAYKNNQWHGLFGRLSPDGYFGTTLTSPQPMGKQGCVLHPTQHRIVSVRECARSQGFTDSFKFYGTAVKCYSQIGNAVPPPMARALALELRKSLSERRPK